MRVRVRLTLLYGVAFLAAGAALVTVVYLLVAHTLNTELSTTRVSGWLQADTGAGVPPGASRASVSASAPAGPGAGSPAGQVPPYGQVVQVVNIAAASARNHTLHILLLASLLALGAVGLSAGALGWAMAGRALRPIHRITATARRVADRSLHERIALDGPRDEVKELADTFDAMLERLDRAFDSQRRFVANASHELRTPLAINRTLVEVAVGRPDASADLRQLGGTLLAVNERHERLIDGLLTLAHSENELTEQAPIDLAEMAAHASGQASEQARAVGVQVHGSYAAAPAAGDPVLLERLVQNLVQNGIRHNRPDGWVRVRTGVAAGRSQLVVVNTGPVIAGYEVPGLFEPFRRLATDRPGGDRGCGLGLSIVRSVVRAHGGTLHAQARPGGGLAVRVTLAARPGAGAGPDANVRPDASSCPDGSELTLPAPAR